MPLDPSTGLFERSFSYGDDRDQGDAVTRVDLDFGIDEVLQAANAALAAGVFVVGEWSAASGAFPTTRPNGRPIQMHDAWVVTTGGTVNGKTFTAGEWLIALVNGGGATYAGYWTRCPALVPPSILAWAEDFTTTVGDSFPVGPRDGKTHYLTSGEVGLYQFYQPDPGTPGVWFEISASASTGGIGSFPARADLVTWAQTRTPGVGSVLWAGGVPYHYDGISTDFADLPGYRWAGTAYDQSGLFGPFATRAAFVTWAATRTPAAGSTFWAGGFAYRRDGVSTHIADLPGYTWAGTPHLEHWGIVTSDMPEDCTTDYTALVQDALDVVEGDLVFTGWVKVADELTLPPKVRPHSSRGHDRGGLAVHSDFNLSADAVLTATVPGTEEGGVIGDLGWWFEQPEAPANRAALTQYPPALDISAATRFQFGRIRIEQAWDGVKAVGNFGGLKGDVLEISAFNKSIDWDGALDFVRVNNIHVWPFGFASNVDLMAIWEDGGTIAAQIGRIDGGNIGSLQVHKAKVNFATAYNHLVPLLIGSLHLDGDGAKLNVSDGRLHVGVLRSSKTSSATGATVTVSGDGELRVGLLQTSGAEPVVLNVTGGIVYVFGGLSTSSIATSAVVTVSAGTAIIRGLSTNYMMTARAAAMFRQSGTGVLRVEGGDVWAATTLANIVSFATTVAGNFFDAPNMIIPIAADNTAALAAGCIVGMKYQTATGEMRIVV